LDLSMNLPNAAAAPAAIAAPSADRLPTIAPEHYT